jgi:trans-aconitate 2-methyltransferase
MVRIPSDIEPKEIWDLGCGTGEHAAVLKMRHPAARVHGLDSSVDMLAEARTRDADVDWVLSGIDDFRPETPADLIFTNAALHWVGDFDRLVPRLAGDLDDGGVFACQVPLSYSADWYDTLRETAADPRWAQRLARVKGVYPIPDADRWYGWLSPICGDVDIWSTTYLHVLEGEDPIVEWMSGTGLRPYLQAFDDAAERAAFVEAYRTRTAAAFPQRADGTTLFPFPRLFVMARR